MGQINYTSNQLEEILDDVTLAKGGSNSLTEKINQTDISVENISSSLADIAYKQATVNGREIQLTVPSFTFINNKYISVEIIADIPKGNALTVKVNSDTAVTLKDIDSNPLTSLDKGLYTFIARTGTPDFFLLAPKGGVKINGNVEQYEINTGQTIKTGDFVKLENNKISSATEHIISLNNYPVVTLLGSYILPNAIGKFDDSIIVTGFRLSENDQVLLVATTIKNGIPIRSNSLVLATNQTCRFMQIKNVDATHVAVYFENNTNITIALIELSITSSTLTLTSKQSTNIAQSPITNFTTTIVDNTRHILANAFSNGTRARIITFSGNSFSLGTEISIGTTTNASLNSFLLSANNVMFSYRTSGAVIFRRFSINNTIITDNGAISPTLTVFEFIMLKADNNRFILAYTNTFNHLELRVGEYDIQSNTISYGTSVLVSDQRSRNTTLGFSYNNNYIIGYSNQASPTNLSVNAFKITSNNLIELQRKQILGALFGQQNNAIDTVKLDNRKIAMVFGSAIPSSVMVHVMESQPDIYGIAKQNGTAGEIIEIYTNIL